MPPSSIEVVCTDCSATPQRPSATQVSSSSVEPADYSACYRTIAFGRSKLKVELNLGSSDAALNSARLEALYERKAELERVFGEPLSWEELEGRKATRIAFYRDASILNEKEWESYFSWIARYFSKLSEVAQSEAFHSAMSIAD